MNATTCSVVYRMMLIVMSVQTTIARGKYSFVEISILKRYMSDSDKSSERLLVMGLYIDPIIYGEILNLVIICDMIKM